MEKRRRIVNCVNDPSRKIKHQVKVYFDDLAILSRPLVQLSVSSEALKTVTYDRKSPFSFVGVGKALLMKGDATGAQSQFALALSMTKNKNSEILRCVAKAYLSALNKLQSKADRVAAQG